VSDGRSGGGRQRDASAVNEGNRSNLKAPNDTFHDPDSQIAVTGYLLTAQFDYFPFQFQLSVRPLSRHFMTRIIYGSVVT
jgi:hypothetical protein